MHPQRHDYSYLAKLGSITTDVILLFINFVYVIVICFWKLLGSFHGFSIFNFFFTVLLFLFRLEALFVYFRLRICHTKCDSILREIDGKHQQCHKTFFFRFQKQLVSCIKNNVFEVYRNEYYFFKMKFFQVKSCLKNCKSLYFKSINFIISQTKGFINHRFHQNCLIKTKSCNVKNEDLLIFYCSKMALSL